MARSLAFEYTPRTGPLHRLHPIVKLAFMAAASLGALGADVLGLSLLSLAVLLLARFGRIAAKNLLAGAKSILLTTAIIVLFSALDFNPLTFQLDSLYSGLRFLWAIGISFSSASLFFYTTKLTELREAIESVEHRLFKKAHPYYRFSLLFTLTLGFIPRVFLEWSEAEDAWLARGGKKGLAMMVHLIPSVLERLIISAKETAHALELRFGR